MVRQCQVCKKLDYLNPEVSFHRFPTDPERRKLWFSLVGFEEGKQLPKRPEICSDHFEPRDIHTKANGLRYINTDANPQLCPSILFYPSSYSSDSTVYDTPPKKSLRAPLEIMEEDCNLLTMPSTSSATGRLEDLHSTSSSATVTASEAEELLDSNRHTLSVPKSLGSQSEVNVTVTKKRKRGYIGEMSSTDFSTPTK